MTHKQYRRFINDIVRRDREADPDGQGWAVAMTDAQRENPRIVSDYAARILMTGEGLIPAIARGEVVLP